MLMAVQMARNMNVPTIIDGSGLNFVAENPECVRGFSNCLLTPNIAEFGRLAAAVGVQLEGKIGVQWQQQVGSGLRAACGVLQLGLMVSLLSRKYVYGARKPQLITNFTQQFIAPQRPAYLMS
jgi:hypothetical protein